MGGAQRPVGAGLVLDHHGPALFGLEQAGHDTGDGVGPQAGAEGDSDGDRAGGLQALGQGRRSRGQRCGPDEPNLSEHRCGRSGLRLTPQPGK